MDYIISVVVPTKNRYIYLKHLINLIDSFQYDNLEFVIQDNSDNNQEILEFLSQINNANIKYFYCNKKLSMSENSDLAVLNSRGEYVCFIGDDDGVCRNIVDCVLWMKKNDLDSIRMPRISYLWGDYNKSKHRKDSSQNLQYKYPKFSYYYADPIKELNKSLKKGFQSLENMPLLYNNIVKRQILDKIYDIGGTYFPGASPDISNSVSLCFFVNKHAYVDIPVVIAGTSQMTGGGIYKRKGRISKLEEVGFISQSSIDNWEDNIPRIWAGRLAWPESGIKALRYVNKVEYIKKMNSNYMYGALAVYYRQLYMLALKNSTNKLLFSYYFLQVLFTSAIRVIKNKIISMIVPNREVGMIIKTNISDIKAAEHFLFSIIKENSFQKLK